MENQEKTIRLNFIVTEEEKILYKKLAHRKEMSLTDLIKSILNEELEKQNLSLNDVKKK